MKGTQNSDIKCQFSIRTKKHRPPLTTLSLFRFVWDIKVPTLLFIKSRGCKPQWYGTTFHVGNEGVDINRDASPVSSPVAVLSYCGKFNKVLNKSDVKSSKILILITT